MMIVFFDVIFLKIADKQTTHVIHNHLHLFIIYYV